jgi:hypothetical protein
MKQPKQPYSTPKLTIYGSITALTQGPARPKTGDNPIGGLGNDKCKPKNSTLCS